MLDSEPTGAGADPTAGDQSTDPAASPPAKKTTRSRRRKAPEAGEAPATPTGGDATPPGGGATPSGGEPAAAPAQPATAGPDEPASTRGTSAAPLFMAPQPAPAAAEAEETEGGRRRRRSRRAAEPAGVDDAPAAGASETVPPAAGESAESTDETAAGGGSRPRRRGRRGRGRGKGAQEPGSEVAEAAEEAEATDDDGPDGAPGGEEPADTVKRRRRRRRRKGSAEVEPVSDDGVHTVVKVREPRPVGDEVRGLTGSTRLEAKRQRRRGGREQRRTRPPVLSESEFLARREAVDRVMVIREANGRTQIAVLEDGILVEHYVSRGGGASIAGSVYLGRVQNVLPSMEAAFIDVGRGRNAVLYAGEVNWAASGLEGKSRSIEQALKAGDSVLVQVTKDPVGHKGARLTSHIALSGRHLVYVPNGTASGISRKLPDTERRRLRDALRALVPGDAGVIVRTAAEGASEDELARDVKRLQAQWEDIQSKAAQSSPPAVLYAEPDLVVRVVRDLFNEDFRQLLIQGQAAYDTVEAYLAHVSPDLVGRLRRHTGTTDVFAEHRVDEQILKGLDRKVYLPSGGHLVIDKTEAMTVVDVNTGKYTGAGGNLEETVTRNNLEAAEEIVRQLRLRDIGGIIVVDFIDMVLESNRELVLRRLTECLGRDRTKHQVTEITSLGLVQMTRKRVGAGLLEAFSETCDCCKGRGVIVNLDSAPDRSRGREAVEKVKAVAAAPPAGGRRRAGRRGATSGPANGGQPPPEVPGPGEASAPGPAPAEEVDPLVELPEFAEPGGESQLSADGLGVVGMFRRFRRGGTRRRTRP